MTFILMLSGALWMGILTSISPCPLASNIAAVSFLGRKVHKPRYVLMSGIAYTLGRTVLYTGLGAVLALSMNLIPGVSMFLQKNMNTVIGPVLLIVGLVMLEIIPLRFSGLVLGEDTKKKLEKLGLVGAFALGFLFALALCPVSAALFFGNLIQTQGNIAALAIYGIGTGLPVLAISFILAFSANKIGKAYNLMTHFETYARKITAVLFIAVGLYFIYGLL